MNTTETYLNLLREFKRSHAAEYGIERIGIFGSVARGEQKEDSDIDVFYDGPSLGLKSFTGLPLALEDLFGVRVDVVRNRPSLNPRFKQRIEKEVIYV
jgi:predicted nucleotidyltransferase